MNKPTSQKNGIFYGWWIVLACFFLLFLVAGAGFYSFSIFIKPLEEDFGWSRASVSLTMSIYFILTGLLGPFVGKLIQTYGPKKIMSLSALASGVCFILVSFTHSLWYFYGSYALLAVSNSGIGIVPVSSLLARWFIKRRGIAIGFAMVGISVGGLVMAPLVGLITTYFSWKGSFVFLGLLVWALALPMTLFVVKSSPTEVGLMPDGDEPRTTEETNFLYDSSSSIFAVEKQGWPLRSAIRNRAFKWIAATFFLVPIAQMGIMQHQVPIISEAGISGPAAATALGLTAGMGGLGKLTFGRISEILSLRYAASLCFGLQALGVFVLIKAHTIAMVWAYVLIFGFAMGGVIVLLPLVVGHFFGLVSFGVILGTLGLTQALGGSVGAIFSGLLYDHWGSYHYALLIFSCVYLIAIITILLAGKPEPYN